MGHTSFRRYTNLVATIQMLRQSAITLLDPGLWDDRNDSYSLARYKSSVDAKSVLALCFAEQHETYHHWRVFAPGHDGVCIQFRKEHLIEQMVYKPGILAREVEYREIRNVMSVRATVDQLPFIKRFPYRDEKEFRFIYVDKREVLGFKDFDISLDVIERINLSPWIPRALSDSVKATIRSLPGCANLSVSRSTLVENNQWKKHVDQAIEAEN